MKVYRPKSVISKYYAMLFSLPKWQYLIVAFIAIALILILSMGYSSFPLLLNSLFTFVTLRVYAYLHGQSVFYKAKRSIGLALAVLIYSVIFTAATKDALVAIASSVSLIVVVLRGLDGTTATRYAIASIPPLATLGISHLCGYFSLSRSVLGFVAILAVALLDVTIYAFMSRRKLNRHRLPDIGTLFLRNWLDRRTEIERVFDELGEYQYVNPRIIELGGLAIIYTDVHYGPFSNIGSSRLPKVLLDVFRGIGFTNVISLHGLGSHDRNIASSIHVQAYINALVKKVFNSEKIKLLYHGAFIIEENSWRVLGAIFDKFSLMFVSRPGKGIDDLPYIIQVEYELKAKRKGLGDVVIVDSHNWELEEEPNITALKVLLDRCLEKVEKIKLRPPVEVQSKYRCLEARSLGLIGNEVCILCIGGAEREEVCLIYLRGNNMKPGTRDLLIKEATSLATKFIEVLTNDEHSETGTRSYIAYIPVHESQELLEAVRKASTELMNDQPIKGAWLYTSRMDLKLMGRAAIELERLLKHSIRETAILLLTYVFGTPIILSFLI